MCFASVVKESFSVNYIFLARVKNKLYLCSAKPTMLCLRFVGRQQLYVVLCEQIFAERVWQTYYLAFFGAVF